MVAVKPVATCVKKFLFGIKSPAICSVMNRSNGMLSLSARISQSRHTHM